MSTRTETVEQVDCDICGDVIEQDCLRVKPHYRSYEEIDIADNFEITLGFDCCKVCLKELFSKF